jgi:asparagine synthase (glutamine-hydrolysing)
VSACSAIEFSWDSSRKDSCDFFFDGYLTEREQAFAALGIKEDKNFGDLDFLALAYSAWGEELAHKIHGVFTLAVADHRRGAFFALRDAIGTRPFFYTAIGKRIIFSSDLSKVARHPHVSRELNEENFAFLLANQYVNQDSTTYKGIFRLPPGHRLNFDHRGIRVKPFWRAPKFEPLNLKGAHEYAEVYKSVLTNAIRDAEPLKGRFGIFVSGGLDSSSISAISAQKSKPTLFSAEFQDPEASSRGLVSSLAKSLGLDLELSYPERDLSSVDFNDAPEMEDLYSEPSFLLFQPLLRRAKELEIRTLFLGHGGDDLLCPPPNFLADLLVKGQFRNLLHELKNRDDQETPSLNWFYSFALRPLVTNMLGHRFRRFFPKPPPAWVQKKFLDKYEVYPRSAAILRNARKEFLANYDDSHARADLYLRLFVSGAYSFRFEQQEMMAMRSACEFRYPLHDMRLVEFVFRLPIEQLTWRGTSKIILREAMKGLLPETIRQQEKFQDYTCLDRLSLFRQSNTLHSFRRPQKMAELGAIYPNIVDQKWDEFIATNATEVNYQILNLERLLRAI